MWCGREKSGQLLFLVIGKACVDGKAESAAKGLKGQTRPLGVVAVSGGNEQSGRRVYRAGRERIEVVGIDLRAAHALLGQSGATFRFFGMSHDQHDTVGKKVFGRRR